MPYPPPKPSSPAPFQRSRAHTMDDDMDQSWPPSHHPPQGSFLLQAIEDNVFTPNAANGPLHTVDNMLLQVVRDKNGNTLGMRVIDPKNTMGKDANVCAPLPLGESTTGIAFNVGSAQAMREVFMQAKQVTDSERIVGVMFAPVKEKGKAQDVDWSILDQGKKAEKDTAPKAAVGRSHGIDHRRSRRRHTTNDFGESSKPKTKPQPDLDNWSEDSDEAAGLRLKLKEMVIKDNKGN
ncbi:hypothetical protein FSHL1_002885 [Fusarium sambucinum]